MSKATSGEAGEQTVVGGGHRPAGRPRLDEPDRELLGGRHGGDAASREHHVEPTREARRLERGVEAREVALDERLDVGVGARRTRTLELADLGGDLGGD
jgi:hypothetical protein